MPPKSNAPRDLAGQVRDARSEVLVGLARAGVPWALFALLTICGNVLRLVVSGKIPAVGNWLALTAALVMLTGTGAAVFDWHLRRHRMSTVGRYIGPVTVEAGSAMTTAFLLSGYSAPLMLTWLFGGVLACFGWDAWLAHAAHHELTIGFSTAAERAGLGDARLVAAPRQRRAVAAGAPAAPAPRLTGRIHLPGGEVTPDQAAERAAALEGARHWPPGAASLVPNKDDGAVADFTLTDPRTLAVSAPWPGPSAPGATMAAPFRMGVRQDGQLLAVRMVPVRHTRATGMTGSGKTMSFLYNRAGEGITRQNFAMFAADITKRWQFLGPLRPALHGAAVDAAGALRLFAALERVRIARMDWMAERNITEWTDECGLAYIDMTVEEQGTVFEALKEASKGQAGTPFDTGRWLNSVRSARSAGMSWNTSGQSGKHTSFPTDGRGSFHPLTFGLVDGNDVAPALSERQLKAGCRPTLWRDTVPGTCYADLPGMEEGTWSMPARFFDWGQSGERMAAYAAEWPAESRPLDELSGEAFENEPSLPASYGLPGPGGSLPGTRPAASNVIAGRFGARQPAVPDRHREAKEAEEAVFALWREMDRDQKRPKGQPATFTSLELQDTGIHTKLGKSRSWIYDVIAAGEQKGLVVQIAVKPKRRWAIVPAEQAGTEEA